MIINEENCSMADSIFILKTDKLMQKKVKRYTSKPIENAIYPATKSR